jgi:UTP--glucose-1-phosphate uridylyltransferase
LINKCLFPAAGYGTRFLPATKAVPKEMLPILTKPLLQFGVEEALSAGIQNMAIVTGRGKRAIEDHFDKSFELEFQLKGTSKEHFLIEIERVIDQATFTYIRQQQMLGLGHAVLTGEPLIGDEPFAVILADDLCEVDNENVLDEMLKIYKKYNCSVVAIEEVDINQSSLYGIIDGFLLENSKDIYKVTDMIEKPDSENAPSNLAIIGRYILKPEIFNILRDLKPGKSGEIQITDALKTLAKDEKVLAYKIKSQRFDCGSVEGFVSATNYFANKIK